MSGHEDEQPSIAVHAVAAAVGTGVGTLLGGPAGAMAGAALEPVLALALHRATGEIAEWRQASAAAVLDGAARRLGQSPDRLVDSAAHWPESAQLLAETLTAAARTLNEQKIRALSRALANGLRDDEARPDEEQLVVSALAEVEAPHIKVLTHLGPERTSTRTQATGLRSRTAPIGGHRPSSLSEQCHLSAASVRAVLSVLQRAGMAVEDDGSETVRIDRLIMELQSEVNKVIHLVLKPPANGKVPSSKRPMEIKRPGSPAAPGWRITPFGQLCLAYLDDVDVDIVASEAQEQVDGQPHQDEQQQPSGPDQG